ncbi:hypothetical protein [Streptantibioticus ferralitis]|uniref:Uncharacterized protein n=1 Tax=Streptantibioticus ferralitis TaxID=236510 RepID=A0ABT5ZCI5_9ACTN|nr:hypothetical protein [Streptantibioticus ferralitis]MDF2261504.1 hypothetical protein [Streptantibioticus ferralitis]
MRRRSGPKPNGADSRSGGEQQAAWAREAEEAAREPEPLCELCGGPRDGNPSVIDPELADASPPDGLHCPSCRLQLAAQPKTRLGRMLRRLA